VNSALLGLVVALASIQDGPVPPQRIDPATAPTPPSTDPVQPTDGRAAETEQPRQGSPQAAPRQAGRIDFRQPASSSMRTHQPASIFTDEAYRRARVRWLLMAALERNS
jgi:hypothetical protein